MTTIANRPMLKGLQIIKFTHTSPNDSPQKLEPDYNRFIVVEAKKRRVKIEQKIQFSISTDATHGAPQTLII